MTQKHVKVLLAIGAGLTLFGFLMLFAVRERVANNPSWAPDAWWQAEALLAIYRVAFFIGPVLVLASLVLWLLSRRKRTS